MKRTLLPLLASVLWLLTPDVVSAQTHVYDAIGRLRWSAPPGGTVTACAYDANGNILSVSNVETSGTVVAGGQATLSLTVVPQSNPPSTGITAAADLSPFGGSPASPMNDNGGGVFSVVATVSGGTLPGTKLVVITFSDAQGRTWQDVIVVEVLAAPPSTNVPTMPQWGMILLALSLMLAAARFLPRQPVTSEQ